MSDDDVFCNKVPFTNRNPGKRPGIGTGCGLLPPWHPPPQDDALVVFLPPLTLKEQNPNPNPEADGGRGQSQNLTNSKSGQT